MKNYEVVKVYSCEKLLLYTIVWEKFGVKKISSDATPCTTKIKHMKIFLPHRNRVVYNGL